MSKPATPPEQPPALTLETRLRAKAAKLRKEAEEFKRQAEIEISAMLRTAAAIEAELDGEGEEPTP